MKCVDFILTGNELLKEEKYREASEHFTEAIETAPANTDLTWKLLYNRAIANSKIGCIRDAIKDCSNALHRKMLLKSLRLRAKCYIDMRSFQKAVKDYEKLLRYDHSQEVKTMIETARLALKRSQSNNYYDILEIGKNASLTDIKKAYKQLAMIHHPDKHSNATNEEKNEQQEQFKRINKAHEVLSNPQKRAKYDFESRNQF